MATSPAPQPYPSALNPVVGDGVGWVQRHTLSVATPQHPLTLRCGQHLSEVHLAYETYGQPNADKSNAILVCHALTGDAHAAGWLGPDDMKPGWWHAFIGPGRALDTNRFWVVCSNVLGGCQGSTGACSINPATGQPYGLGLPVLTVDDMVNAQHRLMQGLGIQQWRAVVGGSLGGFQALVWAAQYPQALQRCVLMATAARVAPQAIAFNAVGRYAIMNDPAWQQGAYRQQPQAGLATARMLAHITYLSEVALERKFGRSTQQPHGQLSYTVAREHEFAVESYLGYQGRRFVERFDANTYLYLTKAMDYFDMTEGGSRSLTQALAAVVAPCLLLSFDSDWLFPPADGQALARALRQAGVSVANAVLPSEAGHDAFLLETEAMTPLLQGFLSMA
jgi:homoserine O-acetyltransferase/O-succinyltransferase